MLFEEKVKELLKDEDYFLLTWGDEFIRAQPPRIFQLLQVFKRYPGILISAVKIKDKKSLSRYGIGKLKKIEKRIYKLEDIVEKPSPDKAPSNIAVHGAYILPKEIFKIAPKVKPDLKGEYQLVEAIRYLIKEGFPAYAVEIKNAKYYDAGNKLEYLKSVVELALEHPELKKEFEIFLKNLYKKLSSIKRRRVKDGKRSDSGPDQRKSIKESF